MATFLGDKATGNIVKLKENGTLVDFYVAKHDYESELNGSGRTLLVRKDVYDQRQWDTNSVNAWASCSLRSWLNGAYLNLLDADIRALIGTTKYYYTLGNGNWTVTTRADSVFQLSMSELGKSSTYANVEGSALPIANTLQIAYNNGSPTFQWTRSPDKDDTLYAWGLSSNGVSGSSFCSYDGGGRPAFTLPSNLYVNDDGSVSKNTAPTTPATINVPSSIKGGSSISISWSASSDAQGNLEGYILERSTNGGDSWSQIYQGRTTSTTNTVTFGTVSVMYRVKAYDTEGLTSGYRTSAQVMVTNNSAPGTPASITVPDMVVAGGTLDISWAASADPDGNPVSYQLERSTNGGSAWTKIYDGALREYTDSISQSWSSVTYRVRAYDTLSAFSGYKTSPSRTVRQLTVATITVPSVAMEGQPLPVSWPEVAIATTYTLERKANTDDSWMVVYTGAERIYSETTGDWTSVQYRVKAGQGSVYGDYTQSRSIPVVSAAALVISGEDSDLGTLTRDFPYTVTTDTGNPITLTRKVNGRTVATLTVDNGFAYTIPVMDLPTGTGTIVLEASVQASGGQTSATRTWTYTKTPIQIPGSGGVATLAQNGQTIFPPTIAEAVRVPAVLGGSLDKALELLLPLLEMAVTAVGSYTGTGAFGSQHPNTLTLEAEPEVVTISGNGKTLTISNTIKTEGGTVGYIEGTTVTWYNDQSAEEQLNQKGVTYTYTAVSKAPLQQLRADLDYTMAMGGLIT